MFASLVVGLGACSPEVFGQGDAGQEPAPTDGSGSTTTSGTQSVDTTAESGEGSSEGSGGSTGGSGPGSTTSASASEGSTSGGSTGGVPAPLCAAEPNLVACYDFAGVGGGMLVDLSGNGNDAPAVGVGVVAGPFGEAATFDDSSQIAVPDSPSLDITGDITVEFWLWVDALPAVGRVGVMDNDGQYSFTIHDTNEYRCAFRQTMLMGPVVLGEWTHVACVYDGVAQRLYINGVLLGSLDTTGELGTSDTNPVSIGDTSPDFEEPLTGAMGGMRVWSEVRTAQQLCDAAGDLCAL